MPNFPQFPTPGTAFRMPELDARQPRMNHAGPMPAPSWTPAPPSSYGAMRSQGNRFQNAMMHQHKPMMPSYSAHNPFQFPSAHASHVPAAAPWYGQAFGQRQTASRPLNQHWPPAAHYHGGMQQPGLSNFGRISQPAHQSWSSPQSAGPARHGRPMTHEQLQQNKLAGFLTQGRPLQGSYGEATSASGGSWKLDNPLPHYLINDFLSAHPSGSPRECMAYMQQREPRSFDFTHTSNGFADSETPGLPSNIHPQIMNIVAQKVTEIMAQVKDMNPRLQNQHPAAPPQMPPQQFHPQQAMHSAPAGYGFQPPPRPAGGRPQAHFQQPARNEPVRHGRPMTSAQLQEFKLQGFRGHGRPLAGSYGEPGSAISGRWNLERPLSNRLVHDFMRTSGGSTNIEQCMQYMQGIDPHSFDFSHTPSGYSEEQPHLRQGTETGIMNIVRSEIQEIMAECQAKDPSLRNGYGAR